MAYTGTSPTVSAIICEDPQPPPGVTVGGNCLRETFATTVLYPPSGEFVVPEAQKLSDLFSVIILLVAMVFIIGMIKKAIEK